MSTFRVLHSWLLYTWGGLHRYFGNQNGIRQEHERAVHYFTRAYEVNPKFTYARLQRGILLGRELGRYEEALADFDALLPEEPDNPELLLNKGLVLQQMGEFETAVSILEQYLALPQPDLHRQEARRMVETIRAILAEDDE